MRKKLHEYNIRTKETNGEKIPIIPIYTYKPFTTLAIAKELYEHGVYVNPSLPPATAPNECLLRTSLMATHTEDQIAKAVSIIAEVLHRHNIGSL